MTSSTRRAIAAIALGATLFAAGCTAVYRNHGYVPSEEDLALVEVGKSSRDDVTRVVGRPSSAGLLQGAGWYYVGSRWKHLGARAPEEIEREVVAISFDEKGTVTNVERFGLEDGQVVVLSRRVTETSIKGVGLIRQVLGSFGRVSADQILNR